MMDPVRHRNTAARALRAAAVCIAFALGCGDSLARTIQVTVLDRDGRPVENVAVYVRRADTAPDSAADGAAVMDQVDLRFEPHLLIVQSGTLVRFPNSDPIAHHVYSFSHPNHFNLPMYKGNAHPPVRFEESGVVTLGCNIHDDMLGYILVVDSPSFAKTNADGVAVLQTEEQGEVDVSLWSPRIRDEADRLTATVPAGERQLALRLERSLRPPHGEHSGALSWSEY